MPAPSPSSETLPFGTLLRSWRTRRRLSQLDLALEAEISSRHLSFIETGRSRPSRDMVLRLAEELDLPLRDRNALLLAAGYAPLYPERPLADHALAGVRSMIERVLKGHLPFPAIAVDRHWTLVAANEALAPLLEGADPALLAPPVNVLRLSLHPAGVAPRIVNLPDWRAHILSRLRRELAERPDAQLAALAEELSGYPLPSTDHRPAAIDETSEIAIPLQIEAGGAVLSFLSTTMVFGTPRDVTVSELAIEAFFPADDATAAALARR
jgi:transcriptional regulator with XRE-family HTH domain